MNKLILEDKEYTLSDELIEKIKDEVKIQEKRFRLLQEILTKIIFI